MKLASSWSDISVDDFIELQGLKNAPYSSLVDRQMDTLLICSDMTEDEVEELTMTELHRLSRKLQFLNTEPNKNYTNKFGEFEVLPFNKITWGMFIDLEYYYTKDYVKNMKPIIGVLLRQIKQNAWNVSEYEPYNYDPKERGSVISHLPITSVYGLITSYLDYRNNLIDVKYSNLFERPQDEDEEELTGQDRAEAEKQKAEEKKFNKWAYESITMQLAGDDITKMNDVLNLSLIYVLNILSMRSDLM